MLALGCAAKDPVAHLAPSEAELTRWSRWPSLEVLDGARTSSLSAAVRGPTALAFFATYCPPCLAEIPTLEAAHAAGRAVLGISLDAPDAPELAALRVAYPVLVLDERSRSAANELGGGLPFGLVVDGGPRPVAAWRTMPELRGALGRMP